MQRRSLELSDPKRPRFSFATPRGAARGAAVLGLGGTRWKGLFPPPESRKRSFHMPTVNGPCFGEGLQKRIDSFTPGVKKPELVTVKGHRSFYSTISIFSTAMGTWKLEWCVVLRRAQLNVTPSTT